MTFFDLGVINIAVFVFIRVLLTLLLYTLQRFFVKNFWAHITVWRIFEALETKRLSNLEALELTDAWDARFILMLFNFLADKRLDNRSIFVYLFENLAVIWHCLIYVMTSLIYSCVIYVAFNHLFIFTLFFYLNTWWGSKMFFIDKAYILLGQQAIDMINLWLLWLLSDGHLLITFPL